MLNSASKIVKFDLLIVKRKFSLNNIDNARIFSQNVDLETQIPQLQNEIRAQEEKSQNQRARETELVDRINTLQREIQASRNEMSSNNSNNAALTGLMNEKRNGNIEGIFGRLGDLGGIDPHYDVAISTCCSQLENVVVDNVTTAQKCIDFLKRNNLARITFIALDKQQKWWKPINEKPQTLVFKFNVHINFVV